MKQGSVCFWIHTGDFWTLGRRLGGKPVARSSEDRLILARTDCVQPGRLRELRGSETCLCL